MLIRSWLLGTDEESKADGPSTERRNMEYRIICKYYSMENEVVEIGTIKLPDKPRPGEVIWIEDDEGKRLFIVIETIRQYYKSPEIEGEVLSKDVFVHEIMYSPAGQVDDSQRLESIVYEDFKLGGNNGN